MFSFNPFKKAEQGAGGAKPEEKPGLNRLVTKGVEQTSAEQKEMLEENPTFLDEKEALAYQDRATKEAGVEFSEREKDGEMIDYEGAEEMITLLRGADAKLREHNQSVNWDAVLGYGESKEKYDAATAEILRVAAAIENDQDGAGTRRDFLKRGLAGAAMLLGARLGLPEFSEAGMSEHTVEGVEVKLNTFGYKTLLEQGNEVRDVVAAWVRENKELCVNLKSVWLESTHYSDKSIQYDYRDGVEAAVEARVTVIAKNGMTMDFFGRKTGTFPVERGMKVTKDSGTKYSHGRTDPSIRFHFIKLATEDVLAQIKDFLRTLK